MHREDFKVLAYEWTKVANRELKETSTTRKKQNGTQINEPKELKQLFMHKLANGKNTRSTLKNNGLSITRDAIETNKSTIARNNRATCGQELLRST